MLDFNIRLGVEEDLALQMTVRTAARGVVFRVGKLLMLGSRRGDFKLPGGGVKKNESLENALKREVAEETGYRVTTIIKKIGVVTEVKRDDFDLNQLFKMASHYFLCEVEEVADSPSLDDYECEMGFKACWISIHEAIEINKAYTKVHTGPHGWTKRENEVLENIKTLYRL